MEKALIGGKLLESGNHNHESMWRLVTNVKAIRDWYGTIGRAYINTA